ncbi:MAG: ssDNA-binding protein [Desulfobulbia bacterium]
MARASKEITLNNVMLSYCNLVEPVKNIQGDGMEYSTQVVISKDHPQLKELIGTITEIAGKAFPDKPMGQLKIILRDNDTEGYADKYDYLKNTMFMNVRRQVKQGQVPVVNRQNKQVLPLTNDALFSGCIVNILLSVYSYDMPTAKGVTASVNLVQIVDNVNVERLGNSVDVENTFKPLEPDENIDNFQPKAEEEAVVEATADAPADETALPWN